MSVGGGQMQPEWVELDARIAAEGDEGLRRFEIGDHIGARVRMLMMRTLVASRTPEHVAFLETQKGLR